MTARKLTLPWPPATGNHRHGRRKSGQTFLLPAVGGYYRDVRTIALIAFGGGFRPLSGRCVAECEFIYPKDGRRQRGDLTNLWKVVEDALVSARVIADDGPKIIEKQILTATLGDTSVRGKVIIGIRELEE